MTDLICNDVLHASCLLLPRRAVSVSTGSRALGGLPPLQLAPEVVWRASIREVAVKIRIV